MKKIKRVVLVQPNMKWMDWNWKTSWDIHPLNLCLLGAMINVDYEVTVVDANLENHTREQFKKTVSDLNPDMVGLTLLTNEYSEVAHIGARLIREIDSEVITVLGGVYATVSYGSIYEDSNFDYICVGEGEYSFPQLLKYLNDEGNLKEAANNLYKTMRKIILSLTLFAFILTFNVVEEFDVVEMLEGKGNWSGYTKRFVLIMKNGTEFGSGVRGNQAQLKELWKSGKNPTWATCRYFELTPDGVPRFPVVIDYGYGERED